MILIDPSDKMMLTLQYEHLREIMTELTGLTDEQLTSKSRKVPLPLCRYLIAKELADRGYSVNSIGVVMGKDHATLLNGFKYLEYLSGEEKELRDQFRWTIGLTCPNFE